MRSLLLLAGAALASSSVASDAQFVDPRTAAGAAGEITGQVAPDAETPSEIDPSRDPALKRRPAIPGVAPSLPLPADARGRTPAPSQETTESATSAAADEEDVQDGGRNGGDAAISPPRPPARRVQPPATQRHPAPRPR